MVVQYRLHVKITIIQEKRKNYCSVILQYSIIEIEFITMQF